MDAVLAVSLRHATDDDGKGPKCVPDGRTAARPGLGAAPMRQRPDRLLYSVPRMVTEASSLPPKPPLWGWPRLRVALAASLILGVLLSLTSYTAAVIVIGRTMFVGVSAMLAFGLIERRPKQLPRWTARWALQVIAVAAVIPAAAYVAYWVTTNGHPDLISDQLRLAGYAMLTVSGLLFAPWIAVGALVRQRDSFARDQATAFALERSELERRALDARFRLLQAQVEPHFLFNTLANVQTLVESGAPQATQVLKSLTAYLRAAVPRLHETSTTLQRELELVRAYLEIMHMRMPDRLVFSVTAEPGTASLICPPMTLLTLVENAIRHGIDPSEAGGRIDVEVSVVGGRCVARVTDTGMGLQPLGHGLGTGLNALRERLGLAFGGDTQLRLTEVQPHGVCAEVSFPAKQATA
jgi:hypothetical protein